MHPEGLGVEKNGKTHNELKIRQNNEAKRLKEIKDEALDLSKKLSAGSVTLTMKGGEGGRTFGSVSTKEIVTAIKDQMDLTVDKKKLVLDEAIRNFGTYNVPVKLHPEVTATITVKVVEG